jgi:hypothetical protein
MRSWIAKPSMGHFDGSDMAFRQFEIPIPNEEAVPHRNLPVMKRRGSLKSQAAGKPRKGPAN